MNTNLIREILTTRDTTELGALVEKYLTAIGEDDTGATYGEVAERRNDDVLRAAEYWWNTLLTEGSNQIGHADEALVRQWLNCETAEIDSEGDIWVDGPMAGHWLDDEKRLAYLAWRYQNYPHINR